MIWGNPWAWLGIAGVALPVLIHLLARGHARVHRFPTLRFLAASQLLPTRRTRLHDIALLVVRVAIVVAAVAAMAQPLLLTARRSRTLGDPLARAIIVDTSASMSRAVIGGPTSGETGIVAARRIAAQLHDSAQTSVVLETARPADVIAGASAWLLTQPSRGELDVVSDFQVGAIDSTDLSIVPRRFGVRLSRVNVQRDTAIESSIAVDGSSVVVTSTPSSAGTVARWARRGSATSSATNVATPLVSDSEHVQFVAAQRAAAAIGVPLPVDTTRTIDIVDPGAPNAASALRSATIPAAPWMIRLIARLRGDSLLIDAATRTTVDARTSAVDQANAASRLVVARSSDGRPVISAAQVRSSQGDRLELISFADAGSLTSAALIAALSRAQSIAPAPTELESRVLADDVLTSLERVPSPVASSRAYGTEGPSDARWFWLAALLLIVLEEWLRRRTPRQAQTSAAATTHVGERSRVA
ncbi:MAG TPA: BatA domain-containing protein [Gemmatimonadaceae bacterium]|jgi:hypothetical protein